jgi:hypothetical protein
MWKGLSLKLYHGKHAVTILQDCMQGLTYSDQERGGTVHLALEFDFGGGGGEGEGEFYYYCYYSLW